MTEQKAIENLKEYDNCAGLFVHINHQTCIKAIEALEMQEALKACIEKLSDSRYECFVADRNGVIELLKQFLTEGSAEDGE